MLRRRRAAAGPRAPHRPARWAQAARSAWRTAGPPRALVLRPAWPRPAWPRARPAGTRRGRRAPPARSPARSPRPPRARSPQRWVLGAWGGRAPRGAPGGAWRVLTRLAVRGTLASGTLALSTLALSTLGRSTLGRSTLASPAHIVPALCAVLMCAGRSCGVHPHGPGCWVGRFHRRAQGPCRRRIHVHCRRLTRHARHLRLVCRPHAGRAGERRLWPTTARSHPPHNAAAGWPPCCARRPRLPAACGLARAASRDAPTRGAERRVGEVCSRACPHGVLRSQPSHRLASQPPSRKGAVRRRARFGSCCNDRRARRPSPPMPYLAATLASVR
eukprot:scaffold98855_cov54-Phaeocystis_antarctica.AAC.2